MFAFRLCLLLLLPVQIWAATISTQQLPFVIDQYNQNALMYVDNNNADQLLMDPATQAQNTQKFLVRYFSAWTGNKAAFTESSALTAESGIIQLYAAKPGYGSNLHPLAVEWVEGLAKNMNLSSFPNTQEKGIVVSSDNLRQLPTDIPSYGAVNAMATDYPFDNLQQSYVAAGTPVYIWQTSQDGAWELVMTDNQIGWMHSNSVAIVSNQFIQAWQAAKFVIANDDNIPVLDKDHIFRLTTRIGTLYPMLGQSKRAYTIYVPALDINGHAIIRQATIQKSYASPFPLTLTQNHIAMIANKIVGDSYGWGGLYGFRDCSATMKDLFAVFGIWLPRNSGYQAKFGQFISLAGLSNQQKLAKIRQLGIPFVTFIDLPGHIALYLNASQNKVMTLQTIWRLRTKQDQNFQGAAVIGETVIMPMDLDTQYSNISSTLLSRVTGITLVIPRPHNLPNGSRLPSPSPQNI